MNLKHIKLIITDMDGTLLNSNHEVSKQFLNQYKTLKKHEVLFVAASGRPYYSIKEKLNSIKNDIIIVAENGGIIVDNNIVLSSLAISKSKILKIDNVLNTLNDIVVIYCTKDLAYIKNTSEENVNTVSEYYSNNVIIDSIDEIRSEIVKVAIYHPTSSQKFIFPFVKDFNSNNKVIVSANNWVDISEQNIDKGNALKILQKKHNILDNEILAFGDYNNDIEMLKITKYSFAMANAHPDVKAISNYETLSNDENGVEVIINKLLEQKTNYQKL